MKILKPITSLVLAITSATVIAAPDPGKAVTSNQPAKASAPAKQTQQHQRRPKQLTLDNAEGATIKLWKPDLTTIPLEQRHLKHGSITLPRTGMDNYHAIVAEKDWGNSKEAVIRYEYLRGRPSKHSPTILSATQKTTFEVVPAPIPRGHYHYYSNQEWSFQTRFKQHPIPNLPVVMETTNGSRVETISDNNGMVTIRIPDDFPNIIPGERDRRSADFSVSAKYQDNGITYNTMLSAEYRVDQAHWKSLSWGFAVAGLGMIAGGFIGRTRKKNRS
ncbi:MAG: hypothetical protein GY814_00045 [Gammaproteobacteria bacterium]|nr:hypothetical protein [Gammaproteobacteria bacterium]